MKWIHPKLSHAAAVAALAFSTGAVGCRNHSGAVGNPFLAPDRVPPPATRSLLPGQAQPYYPGDPLPVMQSGTAQGADSATLAAGESQQMPSAGTNLAWNSPSSASSAPVSPEPQTFAAAEPTVAIPADGDSLRYLLPEPVEPQPFTPITASPLAMSPQAGQLAATPVPQVVLPATYSAPVSGSTEAAASSPWRTPYVAQPSAAPANYIQPMIAQPAANQYIALPAPPSSTTSSVPLVTAANSMDVRLRAVSSPEAITPTPRIRLPGYDAAPQTAVSNDGFRPRTSMK